LPTEKLSAGNIGGHKIGFWYLPSTDATSLGFHQVLDYCAKVTGNEMVYYDMTDWDASSQMAAVESLTSSGCDAIIMIVGSSPAMFDYMNQNKVYYSCMTRSKSDEVDAVTLSSDYFCGYVGDLGGVGGANYQNGYALCKALADQGCKKIAIATGSEGETMADERVEGIEACAKDNSMEILSTYRGTDLATGSNDIIATYGSELDGFIGSGDPGLAALQAGGYLGKIKFAAMDNPTDIEGAFKDGYMNALTAGGAGGGMFIYIMFMQLVNALSGADKLYSDGDQIVPSAAAGVVTNLEDYLAINKVTSTTGTYPGGVTPNDILALNSVANAGKTKEQLESVVKLYAETDYWSSDNIQKRIDAYEKM
jgi:ABC-type sugar transport system substrate-binding protein